MIDFENFFMILSKSLIILLGGFLFSRVIGITLHKVFSEFNLNSFLKKIFSFEIEYSEIISKSIEILLIVFFLIISLNQLKVLSLFSSIFFFLLLIIFLAIFSISIGNFFLNFMLGISLRRKIKYKYVEINSIRGKIDEINYLSIRVIDKDKFVYIIPYAYMTKYPLKISDKKPWNDD